MEITELYSRQRIVLDGMEELSESAQAEKAYEERRRGIWIARVKRWWLLLFDRLMGIFRQGRAQR